MTQQERMLEKEDDLLHIGDVLSHCAINTCTNLLDFVYFFLNGVEKLCVCVPSMPVSSSDSRLCILRGTHRPQSRRSATSLRQCARKIEIEAGRGGTGGDVCLCLEYECLSASYAKLLSVFMCVGRSRVRVLTHCPGRDTAKTAVLVIRQFYFLKQTSNRDCGG